MLDCRVPELRRDRGPVARESKESKAAKESSIGSKRGRPSAEPQLDLFSEASSPRAAPSPPQRPEGARGRATRERYPPRPPPSRPRPRRDARPPAAPKPAPRATAEALAQKQREISVSEFFAKNRHLLGFDNPSKALLTTIKEAVDNSLDACEEAGILPELRRGRTTRLEAMARTTTKGEGVRGRAGQRPGIVKAQVPKIFGKLLYGSKFHRLQAGARAAGHRHLRGRDVRPAHDRQADPRHEPRRAREGRRTSSRSRSTRARTSPCVTTTTTSSREWDQEHGTRVELEIVANWQQGQRFVNRYVEQTALANPHATVHYAAGAATGRPNELDFPRATDELPKEALEIKPHPHGVELGALMLMARESKSHDVRGFLQTASAASRRPPRPTSCQGAMGQEAGAAPRPRARPRDGRGAAQGLGETKLMARRRTA